MIHVEPAFLSLLRVAGIANAEDVFTNPSIRVWRSIRERENATLDVLRPDGSSLRIHLKRDKHPQRKSPSDVEAHKLIELQSRNIPTANLIAHGRVADGRSFVLTEDLAGFEAADRLIREGGATFQQLLAPMARLAARLHAAGAFHRDLYLCHFFARVETQVVDLRLIDCARVLIDPFLRRRWQVKDLAAFVYSTREFPIAESELDRWFAAYGEHYGEPVSPSMRRAIASKADRIARHDARLRVRAPDRGVSIPD